MQSAQIDMMLKLKTLHVYWLHFLGAYTIIRKVLQIINVMKSKNVYNYNAYIQTVQKIWTEQIRHKLSQKMTFDKQRQTIRTMSLIFPGLVSITYFQLHIPFFCCGCHYMYMTYNVFLLWKPGYSIIHVCIFWGKGITLDQSI